MVAYVLYRDFTMCLSMEREVCVHPGLEVEWVRERSKES